MENVQRNIQFNKDNDWNWSIDYLKLGQGERQGEKEAAQRYKFVSLIIQFNCLIFKPGQGRRQGEKEEVQRCSAKGFRQRERKTPDGNQWGKRDECPMWSGKKWEYWKWKVCDKNMTCEWNMYGMGWMEN